MPEPNSWALLKAELDQIQTNVEYEPFRPLVEAFGTMVRAKFQPLEATQAVLQVIKRFHSEVKSGGNARDLVRKITGGYIQPGWDVDNVYQNYGGIIVQTFQNAASKPELPDPDPKTLVPIILLVMTAEEAKELATGAAFEGYPKTLKTEFVMLTKLLKAQKIDWHDRYQAGPEGWRIFGIGEPTIGEVATLVLNQLSANESFKIPLAPEFVDIRTLARYRYLLHRLRQDGCVVVMDSISMRHPNLQRAFQGSMLDAYHHTSVVHVAPSAGAFDTVRHLTVVLNLKLEEMEFARRRNDIADDYGASEEIWERPRLEKWLTDRVRKMTATAARQAGIHQFMRET